MRWVKFSDRMPLLDDGDQDGYVVVRYTLLSGFCIQAEFYRHVDQIRPNAILKEWLELSRSTEQQLQQSTTHIRKVEL